MRAVLTTAHGGLEMLQTTSSHPAPRPGPDDVVVSVAATALNYHDIFTRRGMPGIRIAFPIVVGSDIAGVVHEVGENVADWKPGDRVLIDPVIRGERPEMLGETMDGGRAERVRVPAAQLVAVPDSVALEDAAALPLAYGTAYRMMVTRGAVQASETVLILGASGGVGVACLQLAKLFGAKVIAAASSEDKLRRLTNLGADHVINYQGGIASAVHTITGKPRLAGTGGVDVAVNFTGGDTWRDTQKCIKLGGRILTCGATAGYAVENDLRYTFSFEQTVIGSDGWMRSDLEALLTLVADGSLKPVIDQILPLERAADAERMLEDRLMVGKILLKP